MDLRDQLNKDLEAVFFKDFKDEATVAGQSITGYFHSDPHSFDAFQGNMYTFEAPRHLMPKVKKGDLVVRVSDNRQFKVNDIIRADGVTRLIL